jgi:hypothetical protein
VQRLLNGAIGALMITTIFGCSVQQYRQAPEGVPSATLNFPQWKSTMKEQLGFDGYTNPECVRGPEGGQLGFFNILRADPKPLKLLAGQRIYIQELYGIAGSGNNYGSCSSIASFIPETGKSYIMDPNISVTRVPNIMIIAYSRVTCQLKILETDTGKAPDSYVTQKSCIAPRPDRELINKNGTVDTKAEH